MRPAFERGDDPIATIMRSPGRATRAIVDLDAIATNLRWFRDRLHSSTELMAVVKANAYGHGATATARAALAAGATCLGVATVEEGQALRRQRIAAPILVLGPIDPSEAESAIANGLMIAVATRELVDAVSAAARGAAPAPLHLKIDTGMHRYGAHPDDVVRLAKRITADPALRLTGTFTHFARADEVDEASTRRQAERFDHCLDLMRTAGIDPGLVHAANSAAAIRSRRYDYNLVRIGIAMYGLSPSPDIPIAAGMRPALSIRSRLQRIARLAAGDRVSYGGSYEAHGEERVGLVPIGYADGYARALSSRGWCGYGGFATPIRGRVCMDQMMIGIPSERPAEIGDEVVVVGNAAEGAPSLDELARLAGTIPYELAAALSPRVPRYYVSGGCIVDSREDE